MLDLEKIIKAITTPIIEVVGEKLKNLADRIKAIEEKPVASVDQINAIDVRIGELKKQYDSQFLEIPSFEFPKDDVQKLIQEYFDSKPYLKDGEKLITRDEAISLFKELISILPEPPIPKPFQVDDVRHLFEELVNGLPKPENGKSVTIDDVRPLLQEMVNALPKPENGKSVTIDDVRPLLQNMVNELPPAQPGKSVTVDDVRPMLEELVAKAIASIPIPKDGIGAAGAVIDREGSLVLTLTDGKTINLGQVVGKDWDIQAVEQSIAQKVAAIPVPKNGIDGFGFDDLTVEYDDLRTFSFKFVQGERVKSFSFKVPVMIYRDVYVSEQSYEKGDCVTWGGSVYHCDKDTSSKPGEGGDWTLAVKRGRDGREVVSSKRDNKMPVKVN